jgi:hypothetical protein
VGRGRKQIVLNNQWPINNKLMAKEKRREFLRQTTITQSSNPANSPHNTFKTDPKHPQQKVVHFPFYRSRNLGLIFGTFEFKIGKRRRVGAF